MDKYPFSLDAGEADFLALLLDSQEHLDADDERLLERLREHANLKPDWQNTDRYTDEDRQTLWEMKKEEISDCLKDVAASACEEMSQREIDGYLCNMELLLPYHKLTNTPDGMTTEELLSDIANEPEEDHADLVRFGMLVKDETVIGGYRITDYGIEVLQDWY